MLCLLSNVAIARALFKECSKSVIPGILDIDLAFCSCVQPGIDVISRQRLANECPRIVINPVFSWKTYGIVPSAAQQAVLLDEFLLDDIDPETWSVVVKRLPKASPATTTADEVRNEPSVAEKFRLAFVARDERLAPKRAKNARQNQRRAEKAWLSSDTEAKAHVWAGMARKSLKNLAL